MFKEMFKHTETHTRKDKMQMIRIKVGVFFELFWESSLELKSNVDI